MLRYVYHSQSWVVYYCFAHNYRSFSKFLFSPFFTCFMRSTETRLQMIRPGIALTKDELQLHKYMVWSCWIWIYLDRQFTLRAWCFELFLCLAFQIGFVWNWKFPSGFSRFHHHRASERHQPSAAVGEARPVSSTLDQRPATSRAMQSDQHTEKDGCGSRGNGVTTIYNHFTYFWVNYNDLTVTEPWNHG